MAFTSMFSTQASPIVADFGSASVKLLQVSAGEKPEVTAAAEVHLPDDVRGATTDRKFAFLAEALPETIRKGGFKGKRVVCSPASGHMHVQHMHVHAGDPISAADQIKHQLQQELGVLPNAVVVRSVPVGESMRDGQARSEHVVFAIARDDVMRYIDLFRRMRLQTVGVHNEVQAMLLAFKHLNRRREDEQVTTLYVDLGWGSTKAAIAHGADLVFAKSIAIGGRHFDQVVAQTLRCDLATARSRRIAENLLPLRQAPAPTAAQHRAQAMEDSGLAILRAGKAQAELDARLASQFESVTPATTTEVERRSGKSPPELGPTVPVGVGAMRGPVDFSELLEGLADELSMCLRYHDTMFQRRTIDRVVFLGGEARQIGLCQYLAETLRLPAKAGDPLARMIGATPPAGLPEPKDPHPSWAVACGLLNAPVDL
jgi:Tfp pilus assembly PilM family ATPase